jgi:hypothetical protein
MQRPKKGGKKKEKNLVINPGQPARKGGKKNPGINPGQRHLNAEAGFVIENAKAGRNADADSATELSCHRQTDGRTD